MRLFTADYETPYAVQWDHDAKTMTVVYWNDKTRSEDVVATIDYGGGELVKASEKARSLIDEWHTAANGATKPHWYTRG